MKQLDTIGSLLIGMISVRPKLYLIPGTQCDERLWHSVSEALSSDCELNFLEIPMGKTFPEIAEAFSTLFSREPVNLIGFSLGGYIASYFSVHYPHLINRLLVIANSPKSLPEHELKTRRETLGLLEHFGYRGMTETRAKSMLDPANRNERLVNLLLDMDTAQGEEQLISQLRNTSERDDLGKALSVLRKPVHFYYSRDDVLVDGAWLERLDQENSAVKLIPVPGKGHMLPLEKPELTVSVIHDWLLAD